MEVAGTFAMCRATAEFPPNTGPLLAGSTRRKSSDTSNFGSLTRSVSPFGNATPRHAPISLNFDRDLVNFTPFYLLLDSHQISETARVLSRLRYTSSAPGFSESEVLHSSTGLQEEIGERNGRHA
jgi:hypothetical protein